ncbi:MAG: gamma-glutamyltransferase [Bryobacterales bacterium]
MPGGQPARRRRNVSQPRLGRDARRTGRGGLGEPFYRRPIAERIVAQFQKNGGIATVDDYAAYRAEVVEPLRMEWQGYELFTAPLTAGGATMFEALSILQALDFSSIEDESKRTHAWLEALRLAWRDRLGLFGDPTQVDVPMKRLLSGAYAEGNAPARCARLSRNTGCWVADVDWLEQARST